MSSGDGGTNPLGVIEGYQVFCNPDDPQGNNAGDGSKQGRTDGSPALRRRSDSSDSEPPVHFQVKAEPVDSSYEQAATNSPSSMDNTGTATPPSGTSTPVQISSSLWSGGKKTKEPKKADSNVSNVIEQLLRKNEYLLAQNDAGGFKPNPRKSRNPNEVLKKPDNALDSNGTTFLVSQTSQARVSKEQPPGKSMGPGRILRPRSPTRKCSIPEKDKSHFNHAVMESKVNDKSSEKIFRVNTHEMVCAVACKAMFMTQGGALVAHFDLQFYWCNFCPYHTTNKAQLLQHVMEHRFHCKFCRYQSFSRADVIHHTAENHPEFSEAAASLKYCTLLSDYLQIYSQDTEEDKVKRAGGDSDDEPPAKISKVDAKDLSGLYANIDPSDPKKMEVYNTLQKDYEYFDMEVETVDGNVVHEDPPSDRQVMGPQSTYDVSKMITNVQSSGSAIQVLLDKSQTPTQPSHVQPVALVASQNLQNVPSPRFPAQNTMYTPIAPRGVMSGVRNTTPLRAPAPAKPFENRPPPPPPPPNKMRTGSSVSSNLYWSCGYCNFTSHSQGEIKEHSQKTHRGRPHRYVALIRPPEQKGDEADGNKNNNSSASTVTSKDIEIDNADDTTSVTTADIPRNTGETPTYKCFHCSYIVKKPGLLKGHMSYKHKGLTLVGYDVECQSPDKYMYFCPRDDCPFRAKNPTAYLSHVERCTPWHNKELNVTVEPYLLKCLDNTISLAEKMKEQVRTTEEYSCIYCSFTGCYLENVSYHISTVHVDKSVIIKDLVLNRLKRRCFIYFCRFCDWETREREEWIKHNVMEHQQKSDDLRKDFKGNYGCESSHRPKVKTKKLQKPRNKSIFGKKKKKPRSPPVLIPEGPIVGETYVAGSDTTAPILSDSDMSPPKLIQASPVISTVSNADSTASDASSPKMVSILPPVLQCSHCPWTCIGVNNMKEHLQENHSDQVLSFIDTQKKTQNLNSYFYLCPYESCIYSNSRADGVSQHHGKTHSFPRLTNGLAEESSRPMPKFTVRRKRTFAKKVPGSFSRQANVSLMPALLRCKYCDFTSTGALSMKEHLLRTHEFGVPLMFVNLKKRKQHVRSVFFMCAYPGCVYNHIDTDKVALHLNTAHPEHNGPPHLYDESMPIESDMTGEVDCTNTENVNEDMKVDYDLQGREPDIDPTSELVFITYPNDTKHSYNDCSGASTSYCQNDNSGANQNYSQNDISGASLSYSYLDTPLLTPSTSDPACEDNQPTKYCCLLCETNFLTECKEGMKEHYKILHSGEDIVMRDLNARKSKRPSRLFMCRESTCLHHFLDSQSLLLHQLAHNNSPVFECSECRWTHPELMKVMNHLNDAHDNDDADINYVSLQLELDGKTVKRIYEDQSLKLEKM